jgi:uncharacterized membrane protein
VSSLLAAFLFTRDAGRAPWKLLADGFRLHGWIGSMFAMALAWLLAARPAEGLALHLLVTPLAALMFGRELATVAALPAVIATLAWHGGQWSGIAATWLLAGWLPATLEDLLRRLVDRWLPRNIFVFIFASGFFAPGVVFAITVVAAAGLHTAAETATWARLAGNFIPYGLLLSWGEAFLTGLLVAIFTVYQPRWMATFDDARYLRPPDGIR